MDDILRLQAGIHRCIGGCDVLTENGLLLRLGGIAYHNLQHEAVQLGLRQRIGALLLNRVLGGHHQKRLRQRIGLLTDGDLPLLHRFQQCALHFCRRTVDFVRQDEICKNRPLLHLEILRFLTIDQRADQIGRQQVWGKLYPAEFGLDDTCQRLDG